jgi:hypothetical protein
MALYHISAAVIYVMWHEEHLSNVYLSTPVHRMGCVAILAEKTLPGDTQVHVTRLKAVLSVSDIW